MTKPSDVPRDIWKSVNGDAVAGEGALYWAAVFAARCVMEERERCTEIIRTFPQHVSLSDDDAARHGMLVRQTGRADYIAAIRNRA